MAHNRIIIDTYDIDKGTMVTVQNPGNLNQEQLVHCIRMALISLEKSTFYRKSDRHLKLVKKPFPPDNACH